MTFKANEIEQYPYLVYTDDAGNVYEPESGGGGGGGGATVLITKRNDDNQLDKKAGEIKAAMETGVVYIQTGAISIIRSVQHLLEFHFFHAGSQVRDVGFKRLGEVFGFLVLTHFVEFSEVIASLGNFFPGFDKPFEVPDLFHHRLRLFLIVPQVRVARIFFKDVEFFGFSL